MTRTTRKVPIASPSLGEEELQALREPLESGWLTQGPKVAEFEQAFAARHRVPHALATTSCTAAIHLALAAMGVGPGDEVIVPAFTWVASANVVVHLGATPVFADVDERTYNLDHDAAAGAATDRTAAAIPVHLFGLCADMDAVASALPGTPLLEDAACAAGADYRGRPAGSLGTAGAFSFHPRKTITTGEGGMLTTGDPELAAKAKQLRNHGAGVAEEERHRSASPWEMPDFGEIGFNYRMTDLQAAVGIVQLGKLDGFVADRAKWAAWYTDRLTELGWLAPPEVPDDCEHGWQAYVCAVADDAPRSRDEILAAMHEQGIGGRPGTHSVPSLTAYRERFGTDPADYPVSTRLAERTLALPLHNTMDEADYEYVADTLASL